MRRIELAQRDRVQIHAEQVTEDTRQDAAERRVTELYTKAVDQLGSDKAPVRLAGLYGLERLGQGNPDHRQTVVDVVCAYLRMPYTPPDEQAEDDDLTTYQRREELQVRNTAQRILANHLRDDSPASAAGPSNPQSTFWSGIHLDLTGAHLVRFTLADAKLVSIQLNDATLTGETVFRGTRCELAFLQNVNFRGRTDFRGIEFANSAWISFSTFESDVWFHGDQFYRPARFGRHVSFQGTSFHGKASFKGAVFAGSADFRNAEWLNETATAEFQDTIVENPETTSPELDAAPSAWPDGWRLDTTGDHATVRRVDP